ncbi:uroporphyrinogen-III C-methyltransferase [Opitutus terrae]|uniref:uroporphyrinogen-III C-methyltransferase n=1 Tax=Opitutus terrae (strain DSM 11246 / JCM 15787 / PB90-1) TaxID=452637 RepID=B1ZSB6_OPITP|nr:uroporphyrinogen-III C-methyltransferase [Opitutus terrae]ACB75715.1 uroporphyrin-III C-methyltransferase [Opitutus terrae PB90-1]
MTFSLSAESSTAPGRVLLVGAGPGAPDLITLRGVQALQHAQVVLYDDLANAALLEHCPAPAERIYVGKRLGSHSATQDHICDLLIEKARTGRRVVRLKGGDPMIFGRVGEELAALTEAGIPWEIVPGVTAASAAGAMAGIPLTQRGVSSTMVFVTGHPCGGQTTTPVDWRALAGLQATLCVYMGTQRFGEIADELMAGGRRRDTAVAVISNATLSSQHVRIGTLADGDELTNDPQRRPALILIGEVVRWSEMLKAAELAGAACEV